jgi:membrane fusion protein, multidrug efflux system
MMSPADRSSVSAWARRTLPVLLLAACGKAPKQHAAAVPVRVAAVARMTAPYTVHSNGVVEPLQTVSVEAQIGGVLDSVFFREGDEVRAGQVLFRIDPRPFQAALRQAQAALARDAAQAQSAERDAQRYRALVAKDYVTKSQADQADATARALRATMQADSATIETARLNLAYSTIRAPIDGRTGSLLVRRGNLVKANADPLVVINQIHPILVRFPVTQQDFLALQRGIAARPLPVQVETADSVTLAETGTLTFLDNAVDSLTGTVTAKARFENAARTLWPGEYVGVTVVLGTQQNAIAVPNPAVLTGQNGQYVFVVDSAHTARVRPVLVNRTVGPMTVLDSGLVAGETVVIDGQSRLIPGAVVDVVSSGGAAPQAGR